MRVRIVLLMGTALVISLGSILGIGAAVFYEDKSSYILDYNLTQVRGAANSVDSQIEKVLLVIRLIHDHSLRGERAQVESVFEDQNKSLGMKRLLIMSVTKDGAMKPIQTLGLDDGSLVHHLDQMGWDSFHFLNENVMVAKAGNGELAIGTMIRDSKGGGTAYVALTEPNLNLPESASGFDLYLTDASANILFTNTELKTARDRKAITELSASILKNRVSSGARKWSSDKDDYLVAYQRLSFKELTVFGMVPEGVAYAAVGSLVLRSLVLGFSILMIATAAALVFSKRMTEGLRLIAAVTEKVSQGSFAFRVDTRGLINDEIGALATSFNTMAQRIDELMTEVEVRVTSANNKEANTAVHVNLIPDRPFMHANFNLHGSSIFAEQCAGDWWHYEQIGDYVLTFVGKVEARGLGAAMMTASVHGAVTTYAATMRSMPRALPQLQGLVNTLNTAVQKSGHGKLKMACFVGMFDLQTGNYHVVNAGMTSPLLHRIPFGGRPEHDDERYSQLSKNRHPLLGAGDFIQVKPETVQLKPGDMIVWHTPGLVKSLNVKGEHLDTQDLYKMISKLYDEYEAQSNKVSAGMTAQVTEFLGDIAKTPPDDITAVILAVPKKAYFMERATEEKAAA